MRYLPVVVSLFCVSTVASAERWAVRPVDALAVEIYARAVQQSQVVRTLVASVESSNVIVHIQTSRTMPSGIGGMTRFVTTRGGYRYLRITIGTELSKDTRIAILAHELKHACEVAESNAGDVESLRQLFGHDRRPDGDYFETRAAVRIEKLVRQELRATPTSVAPRQLSPPGK
jgi:hypothetical protein